METENIALMRRQLEAVNDRDLAGMLADIHAESEFVPIMAALEGRTYNGEEGIRRWLDEMEAHWEYFECCPEEFHDLGDRVIGFGHWRARGRASGVEVDGQPATWLAYVRDGKIHRWRTFTDRTEGLEAAGVTEAELLAR